MSNTQDWAPAEIITTDKQLTAEQVQSLREHWQAAFGTGGNRLLVDPDRPRVRRLTWRERVGIRLRGWARRLAERDYR